MRLVPAPTSKLRPFLWFASEAEPAMKYYCRIFKGEPGEVMRTPDGEVFGTFWTMLGQDFGALNGRDGPGFNMSISFYVDCKDQAEVDRLWKALLAAGGQQSMCVWLQDRYGVAWQIIPKDLPKLISDPDPARAGAAMQAMMGMRKIDVAALHRAVDAAKPGKVTKRGKPAKGALSRKRAPARRPPAARA
ncbi:MAG TPA: VOC family protein [Candidatus Thermoplasmatota archaeon]|nr:VOC family protein [Candidatus Thermoplasmatota archaeon]